MIKFRLSNETRALLNSTKQTVSKKQENYYNSREFYDKHPDLAPRNVYLYLGRVVKKEDVDKKLNKMFEEPFIIKAKNWFQNKIGKLFNRNNK